MALSTYSDLIAAISAWMERDDVSGNAADFITLAEAGLNRELEAVETDTILTGTAGSRTIDVSSLSVVKPVALFLRGETEEIEIQQQADGTFPYYEISSAPTIWTIDGDNIDFDTLLDQAYTFRFRYAGRFALSDANPTNWLLANHPDVYLSASIVWGARFVASDEVLARYGAPLESFVRGVNIENAKKKRGTLVVDRGLQAARPYMWNGYQW